jgi:hypothetical protein
MSSSTSTNLNNLGLKVMGTSASHHKLATFSSQSSLAIWIG